MSVDEGMVFGEIAYREPKRARRPDRDRRYACLAYEVPGAEDLPIFLDREVADRIERHALSDTSVELGGILLGHECVDDQTGQPFVWISQELEARHYENTQASFTYTHESWEEITRERERRFPDLDIVGWYHTHPDFGIFLSGHDRFIHQNFFAQPLQVAYVVDPIRQTRGFFVWRGGKLAQVDGYYIVAPRGERPRLARVVDELEGIESNAERESGQGLLLTPRLEAELMSLLRRTASPAMYPPPERGQTAAVFTLLGVVGGALALALALWIGSLSAQLRRQTEQIEGLRRAVVDQKRLAALEAREAELAAKETALDALLREVQAGGSNERFVALYERAVRERDAALVRAAMLDEVGRDLVAKNRSIENLKAALEEQSALARERGERLAQLEKQSAQKAETPPAAVETAAAEVASEFGPLTPLWFGVSVGLALLVGLLAGLGLPRLFARNSMADEPRSGSVSGGSRPGNWPEGGIRIDPS